MEFVLDALLDSLKIAPFLLISYILIEVIEYFSASKIEQSKLLTGKFSTLFGASFGLIPQCGFSVVATDLFSEHKLKIGTLLAIYIATSDEAIPLLLMNPDKILTLVPLLIGKFVLAIIVGYSIDLIFKKANQKHLNLASTNAETHSQEETEHHHGCCGHEIESEETNKKNLAKRFLLHPLIHTLKIFVFILIVNIAFNGLIELVGTEKLSSFLASSYAFAPVIATLIGLIPNCASSVVITELYMVGGLSFGALFAGLVANAGIAFVILFKQNKNQKQNFAMLGGLLLIAVTIGYVVQYIGF